MPDPQKWTTDPILNFNWDAKYSKCVQMMKKFLFILMCIVCNLYGESPKCFDECSLESRILVILNLLKIKYFSGKNSF